jgi:hypothetical protein
MPDQSYSATATAGGVATVTISPNTKQRTWIVRQVSIEVVGTAPLGATCTVRKNGNFVTLMIAQGDSAGDEPPVTLYGSDVLTVVWTGLTASTPVKVFIIYDERSNA